MRILFLFFIFYASVFADVSDSLKDMNTHIKNLDELYSFENERLNEIIALNKTKDLDLAQLIFLLSKNNELYHQGLKIKGLQ